MESQNLSKTQLNNLAIYYKIIDNNIFNDSRYIEFMNIIMQNRSFLAYNYAFYTDSYILRNNIFMPVFHTMYLASGSKKVLVEDHQDLWLIDVFNNNEFYIIQNEKDAFDYSSFDVKKINHIRDML